MLNKLYFLIPVLFLLFSCTKTEANENWFIFTEDDHPVEWVEIETAQESAMENGKWVLLDIYTEWCPYCRRMNNETYKDERVLKALEQYYYPVRIDAESNEVIVFNNEEVTMQELALAFQVSSYPTTVILTSEGEPFAAQPGFIDAPTFSDILSYVATESYENMTFEAFQKRNR